MSQARPDQPNILLIMTDEHAAAYSGTYGHPLVQTPHMDRLASMGTTFEHAYCNSPLCLPSRMSFMTGRYVHRVGAYDNGSPLPSDTVTWAHALRAVGYEAVLCGKQHFCGPDQLHGFERQLARDLHAELWTVDGVPRGAADWERGIVEAAQPWPGLAQAGPGHTTEIEVDDEVERQALTFLRDPARREKPWVLNASFIAPHFPLVAPQRFWDMYPLESIDLPEIPDGHLETLHPVYQRMRAMFGCADYPERLVRRARAGYYALISYVDEKIGRLLDALEESGQADNTLVIHFSDHGDMNGEHGMWRKSNFYDASARVPLQMAWPGHISEGMRVREVVSLVDMVASFLEAGGAPAVAPLDGQSLLGPLRGEGAFRDEAFSEYLAHGVQGPMAMLRRGRYKLNYSLVDRPELYDMGSDGGEFRDLAADPSYAHIVEEMQTALLAQWDPVAIDGQVRQSQRERLLIERAHGLR